MTAVESVDMRTRSCPLYIMCSPEEHEFIKELAAREGIPMRELVLRAVKQYSAEPSIEERVAALEERCLEADLPHIAEPTAEQAAEIEAAKAAWRRRWNERARSRR